VGLVQGVPLIRAVAIVSAIAAVLPAAATGADRSAPAGAGLTPGKATFWKGPAVASGDVADPALCGTPAGECQTYRLRLPKPGARLRVALDTPMRSDSFRVDVIDPGGAQAASTTNSNAFDAEAFVLDPRVGTWTIRVMPQGASQTTYRMRAKLETAIPKPPRGHVALLPDLRANPPIEFGFVAPANPANGLYPPDTVNPPADVFGVHPLSCTADELAPVDVQGGAATKCLRFTSGPQNVGAGPFEMRWKYVDDLAGGRLATPIAQGPMFQVIHYGDGTTTERRAGKYSFHVIHGHFHDDHILDYQLFRITPKRRLEHIGAGTKSGFCPADQLFGDWRRFTQSGPSSFVGGGDSGAGNCQSFVDGVLGLSPGWGDVYRWQRPGQYVEFGSNGNGRYVVRATVDVENQIKESREDDNSAYSVVRVTGDRVTLLERGRGRGPFDPHKVVYTGDGPASQD